MIVNFYAIYKDTPLKILSHLLTKTLEIDKKALIVVPDENEALTLDKQLWEKALWVPHCLWQNYNEIQAPILIATEQESIDDKFETSTKNLKQDYLFLMNESDIENIKDYKKLFVIFNANDDIILNHNRKRWINYKKLTLELNFYKQNDDGKFEKQNI